MPTPSTTPPESNSPPATGGLVLFVCPHGAGKSRIAQAYFDAMAPPGWRAVSAGTEPQDAVSAHAPRLLAGTPAAATLDTTLPRPIEAVDAPDLVVAIDCPQPPVPGATRWQLHHEKFDTPMRDEIRDLVSDLAETITAGTTGRPPTPSASR
jgi:protein-tyrosine-phosphatase